MITRFDSLFMYFPYSPYVLRDGNVHKIALADLQHPEWDTKLLLYPPTGCLCPGTLDEAPGFLEELKKSWIDIYGLLDNGIALNLMNYAIPD